LNNPNCAYQAIYHYVYNEKWHKVEVVVNNNGTRFQTAAGRIGKTNKYGILMKVACKDTRDNKNGYHWIYGGWFHWKLFIDDAGVPELDMSTLTVVQPKDIDDSKFINGK
jgi:hypothetical protein